MQTTPTVVLVTVTGTTTEWVIDPLVPVTSAENVPDEDPVAVSVAVPDPVTNVGLIEAVIPDDAVTVSVTWLVKPLRAVTVIVEVPEVLGAIVMLDGLEDSEKSGFAPLDTVTVTVVECDIELLEPVTVTV